MKRYLPGGRGQPTVIVPAAIPLSILAALIPPRLCQSVRLRFQQVIQRFFHAPAYKFPDFCPFVNDVRPKKRKKRTLEYLTQGGACPELRQIFWSRESSRWRAFGDFQPRTDMGMSLLRRRYLFI